MENVFDLEGDTWMKIQCYQYQRLREKNRTIRRHQSIKISKSWYMESGGRAFDQERYRKEDCTCYSQRVLPVILLFFCVKFAFAICVFYRRLNINESYDRNYSKGKIFPGWMLFRL